MAEKKQLYGDWYDVVVHNTLGVVLLSLPEDGERGLVWARLHDSYRKGKDGCEECWGYDTVLPGPWWRWWTIDLPTVLRKATVWLSQVDTSERSYAVERAAIVEAITECLASPGD